jgi:hypothetical protein
VWVVLDEKTMKVEILFLPQPTIAFTHADFLFFSSYTPKFISSKIHGIQQIVCSIISSGWNVVTRKPIV